MTLPTYAKKDHSIFYDKNGEAAFVGIEDESGFYVYSLSGKLLANNPSIEEFEKIVSIYIGRKII